MADTNQPAAEKAPEGTTAVQTEAPAEKSAAPETTASAPEKATDGQVSEAAPQPSSAAAAAAVATGDKMALDKETGVTKSEDPPTADSSASSVVAAAPAADYSKDGEEKASNNEASTSASAVAATTAEPATQIKTKTPLDEFDAKLPALLKEAGHDEMWGVTLVSPASSHVPTAIVLQKFLNANDGDLAKAVDQFKGALAFRKAKKPLDLLNKTFSAHKFADLGAVTVYPPLPHAKDGAAGVPEVFTWNLYGNVKGKMDDVFVPLDEFMNYRIALQELGIRQLNLASAAEPITAEKDPYKIIQVHDYKSISFLRQNPNVKAASTEVIKQFALAYPELLKEKFFVNVPAIMGWMYAVIKVFIAEKTAKKFHPMANGANLAAEFRSSGALDVKQLPKEYGGDGGSGDGKMKDIPGLVNKLKFE